MGSRRLLLPTALLAVLIVLVSAPAATAQCESDADCKFDRVCAPSGACVAEKELPACGKDTDCPGDYVCSAARCRLPRSVTTAVAPATAPSSGELPKLFARVKPSVVTILVFDKKGRRLGQGSGFFVGDSMLATNLHVLLPGERAVVRAADDKEFAVEGVRAWSKGYDLALFTLEDADASYPALSFAEQKPATGEKVFVVGSPVGLAYTISDGIVSSIRDIEKDVAILQITAPISPGSSGSPVLNRNGEVVGVASLQIRQGQNLNFAVPVDLLDTLERGEPVPINKLADRVFDKAEKQSDAGVPICTYESGLHDGEEAADDESSFGWSSLGLLGTAATVAGLGLSIGGPAGFGWGACCGCLACTGISVGAYGGEPPSAPKVAKCVDSADYVAGFNRGYIDGRKNDKSSSAASGGTLGWLLSVGVLALLVFAL